MKMRCWRNAMVIFAATAFLSSRCSAIDQVQPQLRCGSHCLYVAAKLFDKAPTSFHALEQLLGQPTQNGYSIENLRGAAESLGLQTLAVMTNVENLQDRSEQFACIVHINGDHFVVLAELSAAGALLVDPPRTVTVPVETFVSQWDGVALLISDKPLASEEAVVDQRRRRRLLHVTIVGAVVLGCISCAVFGWRRRQA